jgi:hypothetical protein
VEKTAEDRRMPWGFSKINFQKIDSKNVVFIEEKMGTG